MATQKRIIFLDRTESGRVSWRFVLWADVPSPLEFVFAATNLKSAYRLASVEELAEIQAGRVAERVETFSSTDTSLPLEQVQAAMEQSWARFQAELNALPSIYSNYGRSWNGASWIPLF